MKSKDIADFVVLRDVAIANIFFVSTYGVHIGATWRIRLNRQCAAAMRPVVTDRVAWSVRLSVDLSQ